MSPPQARGRHFLFNGWFNRIQKHGIGFYQEYLLWQVIFLVAGYTIDTGWDRVDDRLSRGGNVQYVLNCIPGDRSPGQSTVAG